MGAGFGNRLILKIAMTTFLSIALLMVGTTATLAAFGGKTWKEGAEPILERVTPRGWISLMCLVLALLLGGYKEIHSASEEKLREANEKAEAAKKEMDSNQKQAELRSKLESTQHQLELAGKDLERLDQKAGLTQARLDDAKASLDTVQSTLSQTEIDLNLQSVAQLTTALADSKKTVSDIWLILPMGSGARRSQFPVDMFLPQVNEKSCSHIKGVAIGIPLEVGSNLTVSFLRSERSGTGEHSFENFPTKGYVWQMSDDDLRDVQELTAQRSFNKYA
jgi:hypothetical protein